MTRILIRLFWLWEIEYPSSEQQVEVKDGLHDEMMERTDRYWEESEDDGAVLLGAFCSYALYGPDRKYHRELPFEGVGADRCWE